MLCCRWGIQLGFYGNVVVVFGDAQYHQVTLKSYVVVDDNAWHHVVFTVNRGTQLMTLFVDGAVQQSASISTVGSPLSSYPVTVGQDGALAFTTPNTDTSVANVRVWNTALTPSTVSAMALPLCTSLASTPPFAAWLLLWLTTTEGVGSTTANSGTLGGVASLSAAATWASQTGVCASPSPSPTGYPGGGDPTPSAAASVTSTDTVTTSATQSASLTATASSSRSLSTTYSVSRSDSTTVSVTRSDSRTVSATPSVTRTTSPTGSVTKTDSATATVSKSWSTTYSSSKSPSTSYTPSRTDTKTTSPSKP